MKPTTRTQSNTGSALVGAPIYRSDSAIMPWDRQPMLFGDPLIFTLAGDGVCRSSHRHSSGVPI